MKVNTMPKKKMGELGLVLVSSCLVGVCNFCRSSQFQSSSKTLKVILPFEQYLICK